MTFDPLIPLPALGAAAVVVAVLAVLRLRRGAKRIPVARSTAACALAILAAAGPVGGAGGRDVARSDADVLFVVDTTGSMGALDYGDGEERLVGVRADLQAVVDEFSGAHFSFIRWDSTAQIEVPWTTDRGAVETAISLLRQERTYYAAGTRLDRAIPEMERVLPRRGSDADRYTVLVFVSDGERTLPIESGAPSPLDGFRRLAHVVDGGVVLGYGTDDGGPMRVYTGRNRLGNPFIYDPATGQDAISRIDEQSLGAIAEALGVGYVHRSEPSGMAALAAEIADEAGARSERDNEGQQRLSWIPAAGVLALAAWQALVTLRESAATTRMVGGSRRRQRSADNVTDAAPGRTRARRAA